ncbi:hypothetical protein [Desulfovirgula thermocuniculi]|uniref:hypothetical protein n=1 Tax=Desulfovirgula thermocuniculi TaxID=348842 RepID=UPI00042693E0|nr:hypothetical protein [Desulfovirgula thermocuniculi]
MFVQKAVAFVGSLVFGVVSCAVPALYALAAALAAAALARTPESARAAFSLVPWPLLLAMAVPRAAAHGCGNHEEPVRGYAALAGVALACWALYRWAWPAAMKLASASGLFS